MELSTLELRAAAEGSPAVLFRDRVEKFPLVTFASLPLELPFYVELT